MANPFISSFQQAFSQSLQNKFLKERTLLNHDLLLDRQRLSSDAAAEMLDKQQTFQIDQLERQTEDKDFLNKQEAGRTLRRDQIKAKNELDKAQLQAKTDVIEQGLETAGKLGETLRNVLNDLWKNSINNLKANSEINRKAALNIHDRGKSLLDWRKSLVTQLRAFTDSEAKEFLPGVLAQISQVDKDIASVNREKVRPPADTSSFDIPIPIPEAQQLESKTPTQLKKSAVIFSKSKANRDFVLLAADMIGRGVGRDEFIARGKGEGQDPLRMAQAFDAAETLLESRSEVKFGPFTISPRAISSIIPTLGRQPADTLLEQLREQSGPFK